MTGEDHWPTAIQLADEGRTLKVTFESGETFALPAEFLRVHSPSAEVQGHDPSQKITVPGKKNVIIARVEPVGHAPSPAGVLKEPIRPGGAGEPL